MKLPHEKLFMALARAAERQVSKFNAQNLANTAWSFATVAQLDVQLSKFARTAERCMAQDIRYEPLVFTCQGGVERHAESALSQIAEAVAKAEDVEAAIIKTDLLERICVCLARHSARAVIRRMPKKVQTNLAPMLRCLREVVDEHAAAESEPLVYMPPAARDIRLMGI